MKKLTKKLFSPPSLRINSLVIFEVVFLLVVSLAVLFFSSYQMLKEESMKDAEQTLAGTVQHIDNVLLSIQQSAGNVYWETVRHLDQPDRMFDYCTELVKCNPYIHGCAIAMKPDFYPGRKLFMAYVHHQGKGLGNEQQPDELVRAESFGLLPYTEQEWYTVPMASGEVCWLGPLKEEEDEGVTMTLCMPIFPDGEVTADNSERQIVGVFVVDLSIELLSQIVLAAKPSPNSYCVLLNRRGEYIIHPDKEMLKGHAVLDKTVDGANPDLREIAEEMMAGKKGNRSFTLDGKRYYKFYKPFERTKNTVPSIQDLKWSIGLIYPEQDLFGKFDSMLKHVLITAVVGLLLFFFLCRIIIRIQMKPLRKITESAQRIAEGHYDDPVSDSHRNDEIGQFQQHFQQMQKWLNSRANELKQLADTLKERGDKLRKTHEQMIKDSKVKTTLLHMMTGEMKVPSEAIVKSVTHLCDNYEGISLQEANSEVDTIKKNGKSILKQLNEMLNASVEEEGKEASHE